MVLKNGFFPIIKEGIGTRSSNLDAYCLFESDTYTYCILVDGIAEGSTDHTISIFMSYLQSEILRNGIQDVWNTIQIYEPIIKSSLLILELTSCTYTVLSTGDCRAYLNGQIITEDQSKAWAFLKSRLFYLPKQIASLCTTHKWQNVLLKGTHSRPLEPMTFSGSLKSEDIITLCTDGFWCNYHHLIEQNDLSKLMQVDLTTLNDNHIFIAICNKNMMTPAPEKIS